jgi:uncharacterized protein YndB with AHSA1/START domain
MDERRVELQAEVDGSRADLFSLVASAEGLRRWLDDADLEPRPGARVRFRLREAIAIGTVLAVDEPQHLSIGWDWEGEPLGVPSVVAFDLIDHGSRTHLTLRHIGFPGRASAELHSALWSHWFERLVAAARELPVAVPA